MLAAQFFSDVPPGPDPNPPLGWFLPETVEVLRRIQQVKKHLAAIEKWVKKHASKKKPPKKKKPISKK